MSANMLGSPEHYSSDGTPRTAKVGVPRHAATAKKAEMRSGGEKRVKTVKKLMLFVALLSLTSLGWADSTVKHPPIVWIMPAKS